MNTVTALWIYNHPDICTNELLSLIEDFDLDILLLSVDTVRRISDDLEIMRREHNSNFLFDEKTNRYKNIRQLRDKYFPERVTTLPIVFPDDSI